MPATASMDTSAAMTLRLSDSWGLTSLCEVRKQALYRWLLAFTPLEIHLPTVARIAMIQANSSGGKPSETFSPVFNRTPRPEVIHALGAEFNTSIWLATPNLADIRVTAQFWGRAYPHCLTN